MRVILAAPTVAMVMVTSLLLSVVMKVIGTQLDRLPMRRAIRRMVPGMLVARECGSIGQALIGDEALECVEPVTIVGLAGVGIACALSTLDLRRECRGPLRPGEQPAFVQRQRHRERLRLPRLAEDRSVRIPRDARDFLRGALCRCCVHHAGSRYGSNASIETFTVGSASAPHSSRPSNTTV